MWRPCLPEPVQMLILLRRRIFLSRRGNHKKVLSYGHFEEWLRDRPDKYSNQSQQEARKTTNISKESHYIFDCALCYGNFIWSIKQSCCVGRSEDFEHGNSLKIDRVEKGELIWLDKVLPKIVLETYPRFTILNHMYFICKKLRKCLRVPNREQFFDRLILDILVIYEIDWFKKI